MNWLLDTNVLSELRRRAPDRRVVQWVSGRPVETLYLSVLTLGEIRKGVEYVADAERRAALVDWLEIDIPARFAGRLLPVDATVVDCWGRLQASAGRPLPTIDSLLAATALAHQLVMVTRNARDFQGLGVTVLNPWEDQASVPALRLHQSRARYSVEPVPVRTWREHRGLSRQALAERAGISASFLAQIESGRRKASPETMQRLAAALSISAPSART